jgi:predicted RNase H-like nuclease (RuvC/YqgF family)
MSDEYPNNGLSGWEGIALGRMWAEHDQTMERAGRWFGNRHNRGATMADFQAANQGLAAQNRELAAENLRLKERLEEFERNYNVLDSWAERAQAELRQLRSTQS